MIYIVFGASGTGKSTIINLAREKFVDVSVHTKGTTRMQREYDTPDELEYYQNDLPIKYKYTYFLYNYTYGIEKDQIDRAIEMNKKHLIICNDLEIVKRIKYDYPLKVKLIYLFYKGGSRATIEAIQQKRKITADEVESRIMRIDVLQNLFVSNYNYFDFVIENEYTTDGQFKYKLKEQIERILYYGDNRYAPSPQILAESLKNKIANGFLFIIMPMKRDDRFLEDVFDTIKSSAKHSGYFPRRVDEDLNLSTNLYQKIINGIETADVVIADLTYERPNCYYELGYAHALGKDVIIIAKNGTIPHFDVSIWSINYYDNIRDLVRILETFLYKS
ncbi:hypothetical protein FACS1894184_03460 [Clostridia bacterium]|nr:hypothetical protein FACS1894184_03460 [Clostridia bacterium]